MFKSKVYIISFLLLFSSFLLQADRRENIARKKEAIVKDYKFGKKINHAFFTVSSVLCVGLMYKIIKYHLKDKNDIKIKSLGNRALTKKIYTLQEKYQKIKDPNIFSKRWFKGFSKSVVTSFLSSSLVGISVKFFDKFYSYYHCFDNITDFISVRFRDMQTLDELLYNAKLFNDCKFHNDNPKKLQQVNGRFIVVLNNLIGATENIIAFMEYKIDCFDNTFLSQEDILVPNYLLECLDDYTKEVELILDGKSDEDLLAVSLKFKNEAVAIVESFKGLEARVAWLG